MMSLNTAASTLDIGQLPKRVGNKCFLIWLLHCVVDWKAIFFLGQAVLRSS